MKVVRRSYWLGWLILAGWLQGCQVTWVRQAELEADLLNDKNQLLSIEGRSNLPDGAIIEARLFDREGRRWASGQGTLENGRYYVVLEVSRCPGFRPLQLEVYFDPLMASAKVQRQTGARGEALAGPLVVQENDRTRVLVRKQVVLTMSARQVTLRRLQAGDGDIDELQSYLVRHPNDAHSLIGLGLAYLKRRPAQRHKGSEAYKMLQEGIRFKPAETALEMEARLWVARLDEKERREKEERERTKAPSFAARFRDDTLVRPGQSLGAFELGMGYQFLALNFQVVPETESGPWTFSLREFPGLRLTLSPENARVEKALTRDERYRTHEGIGPGSDVDDLKRILPELKLSYGPPRERPDGRMEQLAEVELQGVNLVVERSYDPQFPIPDERVQSIEVCPITP